MNAERTSILAAALLAASVGLPHVVAGTHTWHGTGFFENKTRTWSDPFNWNGGAPVAGETPPVILIFPDTASEKLTTNDIAGLVVDEIRITGSNYTLFGRGSGTIVGLRNGGLVSSSGSGNKLASSLSIELSDGRDLNFISVATNQTFVLESVLRGTGGFTKSGAGILKLDAIASSLYTGLTKVIGGRLDLGQGLSAAGTVAIPGPLTIGVTGVDVPAEVRYLAANQVADTSRVMVVGQGRFQTAGFTDTIGSLEMDGGEFFTDGAVVTLNGNITSQGSSLVDGAISLGNASRTVAVEGDLTINAVVSGAEGVGIIKTGSGSLSLAGDNIFTGPVDIQAGAVGVQHNRGLGTAAGGVTVHDGASLIMGAFRTVTGEALSLQGAGLSDLGALLMANNCGWSGEVTLTGDAVVAAGGSPSTAVISGAISGPGRLIKRGEAALQLSGGVANSFLGGLEVLSGDVVLGKTAGIHALRGPVVVGAPGGAPDSARLRWSLSHQVPNDSPLEVRSSGRLELGLATDIVGGLGGTGRLELGQGLLGIFANVPGTFLGAINGTATASLWKGGPAEQTLGGNGTHAGLIQVEAGVLNINGTLGSAKVEVFTGATVAGKGTVGSLTAKTGSFIAPGDASSTAMMGVTGNLLLEPGSTYRADIRGVVAGSGHDQLRVGGTVTVQGSQLEVAATAQVPVATEVILVEKMAAGGVTGTFSGLPGGSSIETAAGTLILKYNGGGGNDVSLTSVNLNPLLKTVVLPGAIDEGAVLPVSGTYLWPTNSDVLKLVVDWGDGTPPTTNNVSGGSFAIGHKYADDFPSGPDEINRAITARLIAPSGTSVPWNTQVLVKNRAPLFFPGPPKVLNPGESLVHTIEIIDPGSDTFTVFVNWGDGSPLAQPAVGPDRKVLLEHTYPADGAYTLRMMVRDDDSAEFTWDLLILAGLKLSIETIPNDRVKLSWDKVFEGMLVQRTSDPISPEWATLQNSPQLVGNRYEVILPAGDDMEVFRLVRP